MIVKRYDYPDQYGKDLQCLFADIQDIITGEDSILGPDVSLFEGQFADFLGVQHVIGVNSGTDALILAMKALGIMPGDEVITQANTFYATVAAILFIGAKPILVDAVRETALIDVEAVAASITQNTRAIIPVHLYGKPTCLSELKEIAIKHGISIIEDAAQSHGASINEKMTGTVGDLGCFSFHPSKNLAAAGDAGAVVTNSKALNDRLRMLRSLGQRTQNEHQVLGINSKLDSIQARILRHKLPHLKKWNQSRQDIAAEYHKDLAGLPIRFQEWADGENHVFHLFQIQTDRRNQLLKYLHDSKIDAVLRYPNPIHLQPAFTSQSWAGADFPIAEALAQESLCLPIRPNMKIEEISYVTSKVKSFFTKNG